MSPRRFFHLFSYSMLLFTAIFTSEVNADPKSWFVVYVDRYYGDTLAETVLGKALKTMPIPRESYVVSTKCGRYGSGFDFSAERVTRSVDESLERLNLDYVDIILCHDIEFGSLDQIVYETVPALQKLKDSGKVRHIGISGLPLHIFRSVWHCVLILTIHESS